MKTAASIICVFCALYTIALIIFIIEHPHAFDCGDEVICHRHGDGPQG